jgi:hypothetical protein
MNTRGALSSSISTSVSTRLQNNKKMYCQDRYVQTPCEMLEVAKMLNLFISMLSHMAHANESFHEILCSGYGLSQPSTCP